MTRQETLAEDFSLYTPVTQDEVNMMIETIMKFEERMEELRDNCEYESLTYWNAHDKVVALRNAAEKLMP